MSREKLTPELQEKIVKLIAGGNFKRTAAAACGISESTFYRWLERGEASRSGRYKEFWETIKKAEAKAETDLLAKINTAAADPKTWQAAAWILERSRYKEWGKKEAVDLTTKGEKLGDQLDLSKLTDEELHNLRDIVSKAATSGD